MNILITGGTGFLGKHLIEQLHVHGHHASVLSRSKSTSDINGFYWNPEEQLMDDKALNGVDCIIHLAGASIGEGRWTDARKKEIIESRVKSGDLLYEKLKNNKHNVKTLISASGIGIYGSSGDVWVDESTEPGNDFISEVCKKWEAVADKIASLSIRVVVLRTGIVLGKDCGALPILARSIKLFAGSPLGSGKQYMSWIHINDICRIYIKAAEDERMQGTYNAAAPNPRTNAEFMGTLAEVLKRRLFLPPVPASLLKLLLGEKAVIVLEGQRVLSKNLKLTGFQFQFRELGEALKNIYNN